MIRIYLKTLLAVYICTLALGASAQDQKGDKAKKLEEFRKKFYNEKLSLSEEEQKNFWPLFTEYKEKERKLNRDFRTRYKQNDIVFMDDKKAEQYLQDAIKLKEDQLALFKEYAEKFKKVLPIKKVVMLGLVDKQFKQEVLKKARELRDNKAAPAEEDGDE